MLVWLVIYMCNIHGPILAPINGAMMTNGGYYGGIVSPIKQHKTYRKTRRAGEGSFSSKPPSWGEPLPEADRKLKDFYYISCEIAWICLNESRERSTKNRWIDG